MHLPFRSQSPYRVGSGPLGPSISPVLGFISLGNLSRGSFSASGCGSNLRPTSVLVFPQFDEKRARGETKSRPDLMKQTFTTRNIPYFEIGV